MDLVLDSKITAQRIVTDILDTFKLQVLMLNSNIFAHIIFFLNSHYNLNMNSRLQCEQFTALKLICHVQDVYILDVSLVQNIGFESLPQCEHSLCLK